MRPADLVLLVVALAVAAARASYQNGNYLPAEVYPHTFSTKAYSVHQLPYGITFSSMFYDTASTAGAMSVADGGRH
jgi:hypothetical protein